MSIKWAISGRREANGRAARVLGAMREATAGKLPTRYDYETGDWRAPFDAKLADALRPGVTILDVGPGRLPTIPRLRRPPGSTYVALDVSEEEIAAAGADAYDEVVLADVTTPVAALAGRFDLVVSWWALEHVKPLDLALENIRSYLRPGGRCLAEFSGRFSVAAIVSRALPDRAGLFIVARLPNRSAETAFATHYDQTWDAALKRLLKGRWGQWEITPLYVGAAYFGFSKLLTAMYIGYEEWAVTGGHRNMATHYLLDARTVGERS